MFVFFYSAAQNGEHEKLGWPNSAYVASKIGLSALTRIQQREFNADSREDLVVNAVHPGYVDTDMTSHKGPLTIEQGIKDILEQFDFLNNIFLQISRRRCTCLACTSTA